MDTDGNGITFAIWTNAACAIFIRGWNGQGCSTVTV